MKINGLNTLATIIEEETIIRDFEKKAKKTLISQRVKELMAQGIDKTIAQVMANTEWEYQL